MPALTIPALCALAILWFVWHVVREDRRQEEEQEAARCAVELDTLIMARRLARAREAQLRKRVTVTPAGITVRASCPEEAAEVLAQSHQRGDW